MARSKDKGEGKISLGRGGTWGLPRLCLGDVVGLGGPDSRPGVVLAGLVTAVHHPNHAAPLLELQTTLTVPAGSRKIIVLAGFSAKPNKQNKPLQV